MWLKQTTRYGTKSPVRAGVASRALQLKWREISTTPTADDVEEHPTTNLEKHFARKIARGLQKLLTSCASDFVRVGPKFPSTRGSVETDY